MLKEPKFKDNLFAYSLMFVGAFGLVITFGLVNEYKDENMVDVDEIVSQINQPDDEKSESKLKPKIGN